MTRRLYMLLLVLPLGWLYNVLFWRTSSRAGFSIFVIACLLCGLFVLLENDKVPARKSIWFLPLTAYFAFMTLWTGKSTTYVIAHIATFFCAGMLAVTYLCGGWTQYSASDYFFQFLRLAGSIIARPILFQQKLKQQKTGDSQSDETPLGSGGQIMRGLAIAVPLVVGFTWLLASANADFQQSLSKIPDLFTNSNGLLLNLMRIALMAYILTGIILHAGTESADENRLIENRATIRPYLAFPGAVIVLVAFSAMVLYYASIHVNYLFGDKENIKSAHDFYQQVAVIGACLPAIYVIRAITARQAGWRRWIYTALNFDILLSVEIILVSFMVRMHELLPELELEQMALYVAGLAWLGLLFLIFVLLEASCREREFAFSAVWVTIVFAILLCAFRAGLVIWNPFAPNATGEISRLLIALL